MMVCCNDCRRSIATLFVILKKKKNYESINLFALLIHIRPLIAAHSFISLLSAGVLDKMTK